MWPTSRNALGLGGELDELFSVARARSEGFLDEDMLSPEQTFPDVLVVGLSLRGHDGGVNARGLEGLFDLARYTNVRETLADLGEADRVSCRTRRGARRPRALR